MPITTLASTAEAMNRLKRAAAFTAAGILSLRSLVISVLTVALWALVRPDERLTQLAKRFFAGFAGYFALRRSRHTSRPLSRA